MLNLYIKSSYLCYLPCFAFTKYILYDLISNKINRSHLGLRVYALRGKKRLVMKLKPWCIEISVAACRRFIYTLGRIIFILVIFSKEIHIKKSRGVDWVGIEFGKVLRTPYLYMALVCIFFSGFILQGIWGITAAHLEDVGIDATTVSIVLSVHSLVIAISKFSTGFLYDKFGLRVTSTFCTVVAVVSAVLMTFIDGSPFGIMLAFIYGVICSFALPLETVMLPIYANDLFGAKSFDKVLGLFVSVNTAGYAVGAPVMNLCYDILGSYVPGLIVAAVIMAVLIILLQVVITSAHNMRQTVEREESSSPISEVGAVS